MQRLLPLLLLLLLPRVLQAHPGFYGSGTQADSLANTTIGPHGNQVGCRFRAEAGGALEGIRPFIIWSFRKAGYHGGTGGILKVELQTDDGSAAHLPSGQVLAASVQRLYLVPASDQFFPLITFDRAPVLKPGALYHAVFSNPHPLPLENYVSVNALFSKAADSPVQATRRDEDWAMLYRNADHPWALRRTPGTREAFTPILEVYCAGGSQGVGYMEVWMAAAKPIQGAARVAEVFTVAGPSRKVDSVAVRVRRLAGQGPLAVRLETAGGTALAEGRPTGPPPPSPTCSLGGCGWVETAFPAPQTLRSGETYRLVLAAPDGQYEAFPLRKGADKGFTGVTQFGDGHAEFNAGAGWKGWEQWGQKNRLDSDLQFFFRLGN
jgi:hypothetical protein